MTVTQDVVWHPTDKSTLVWMWGRKLLSQRFCVFSKQFMTSSPSSSQTMRVLYYDEITSTMDQAREVLHKDKTITPPFAIIANSQTRGRGTQGRSWISCPGNLLITIGFSMKDISFTMSLLPLRIGHILCTVLEDILTTEGSDATVDLKWPNDILINGKKLCGVLIEVESGTFLVGIGCNLVTSPLVQKYGLESGREATCLLDVLSASARVTHSTSVSEDIYHYRNIMASKIVQSMSSWLDAKTDSDEQIITDCAGKLSYLPQKLRLERIRGPPLTDEELTRYSAEGDEVWPLHLNPDGTLQVRHSLTNKEMVLAADYLW